MVREWWDKGWITWGLLALLSISVLMMILSLARKPFSTPWVEREPEALTLRLNQVIAAEVDQDWIDDRLEAALAEDPRDWFKIDLILEVAAAEQVSPDPALKAQMESARKADETMLRRVDRCAQCASDTAKCLDVHTLLCNVLSEMGPIRDVKTLVRNAKAQMAGEQVDYHEVGIAVLGLGTGVLGIVGSMVGIPPPAVKMGVTLLRKRVKRVKMARGVRRRLVFLTESFEKDFYRQVRALDLQWSKIPAWVARGGGDVAQVLNPVTFSGLRETAADLGRIYHATGSSLDGTWRLLRHVDSSADATRVARLAETVGAPRTHQAFHVLGKPRVFRAMVRLSDAVIATIIWIIATVVLTAGLVASVLLNQKLRLSLRRFV